MSITVAPRGRTLELTGIGRLAIVTAMLAKTIRRPDWKKTGGRAPKYPYDAIIGTLGTTRAVYVPVTPDQLSAARSAMHKTLARKGYVPRIRMDKGGLAVWVERP